MHQRVTLAALAVACAGVLAWLLLGGEAHGTAAPALNEARGAAAPDHDPAELDSAASASAPARAAARQAGPSASPSAAPVGVAPAAHPWAGRLAGVIGRVVEADGTPVAGLSVELLQADATLFLSAESTALGAPSIELDETRTDEVGRFALDGATLGSFHLLGLDRGGPRATVRFCERALVLGERVDLGDIVLRPCGVVFGRVVDEDGEPVAGARVRVGTVPDLVLELGLLDLRTDSFLALAPSPDELHAVELPRLVGEQLARLPVPTTTTDTNGSFRLAGVPLARVSGGVDHPGHVATAIPAFEMQAGERDLGELELTFGRTLVGRVVDAAGQPAAGIEVRAGVLQVLAPFGVLQPAGLTDAAGAFSLRGVPEMGAVVGFARRRPSDAWVSVRGRRGDERLEIVLPGAGSLFVRVVDQAGAPVRDARLCLVPEDREPEGLTAIAALANVRSPRPRPAVEEAEPGVYAVTGVTYGTWRVEVEADGLAQASLKVEHVADGTRVALTMGLGQRLVATVRDAVTGAPVAQAHTSLVAPEPLPFRAIGSGWTEPDGTVELGPFQSLAETLGHTEESDAPRAVVLRVLHPAYGEHCTTIAPDTTTIDVALTAPCAVVGRVHWGGATPDRRYMVMLELRHGDDLREVFAVPRIDLTRPDGTFRFTGLGEGRHGLTVAERYFDADALALATAQKEPLVRHREVLEVEPGQPVCVDVDLSPTGLGPTASVTGTVRSNGLPVEGAVVVMDRAGRITLTTDSAGRFDSGEISAVRAFELTIDGEVDLPGGRRETRRLYREWVELEPGEQKQIEVDAEFHALSVEVVNAGSGDPVPGARVAVDNEERGVETDALGRAEVLVDINGGRSVFVRADGYAYARHWMHKDHRAPDDHLRVVLRRPVPCAGRVVVPAGSVVGEKSWSYVQIQSNEPGASEGVPISAADGYAFKIDGMSSGRFYATIYIGGLASERVELELGPAGETELVLEYEPQR